MHVCASKGWVVDEVGRAVHAREPTPLRPGSLADLHYGPVLFPVPCRVLLHKHRAGPNDLEKHAHFVSITLHRMEAELD